MKNRMCLLQLFFAALLVPAALHAQSPSAVTGITATADENNRVTVTWNAPPEQNIAYYRVYFSSQSILDNGGVYDDFEATSGPQTTYTLSGQPAWRTLYIAVLAVNDQGTEGEVFTEEAVAVLAQGEAPAMNPKLQMLPERPRTEPVQGATSSQASSTQTFNVISRSEKRETQEEAQARIQQIREQVTGLPSWEERDLEGALHLLLTDVLSSKQIRLLFSGAPTVEPERAPEAFSITDSNGSTLRIESILISGESITVNTETHAKDMMYQIKLSEPLRGTDGSPLHATNRQGFFRGHADGKVKEAPARPAVPAPRTPEQIASPEGIRNLQLSTASHLDGTYIVKARWDVDNLYGDLLYYSFRQSRDGGVTFSDAELLPFSIDGVDIPGVTPGEYGLSIRVINSYGYASAEVFASTRVGPQEPPPAPKPASPPPADVTEAEQPAPEPSDPAPVEMPAEEEPAAPKEEEAVVRHVGSKNLAQTGAGILAAGLAVFAGAGLCMRKALKGNN